MSAHYVKSQHSEQAPSRRIRVFGEGNGLTHEGSTNFREVLRNRTQETWVEPSTVLLVCLLAFAAAYQHAQLTKEAGYQAGLIYDLKYIDTIIFLCLGFISAGFIIFYRVFIAPITKNGLLKLVMVLILPIAFLESFHFVFHTSSGMAHLQLNEAHRFCEKEKHFEKECDLAKKRLQEFGTMKKLMLHNSNSIYAKLQQQKTKIAEMNIPFSLAP